MSRQRLSADPGNAVATLLGMAELRVPDLAPVSRARLKSARKLTTRKGRDDAGEFLAEGVQAVREALRRPELVRAVLVSDEAVSAGRLDEILSRAPADRLWAASASEIAELSDTVTPQGVVAACTQPSAVLDDLADAKLLVICSHIRDPGNAGTVIRCADAFGAGGVILTTGSVDAWNAKTVRASVGSVFHVPVVGGVELSDAAAFARAQGCQVFAAAGGGVLLNELGAALARPTAWVMGNEAWGLPEAERALADQVVGVPMWGQAESLNLSTAAAICLYTSAAAQRA